MRVYRFLQSLRWLVRRRLVSRRNVRTMWIQSDPDWMSKLPPLDLTDEEMDAFLEAIEAM